jgi:hypothetical protein
MNNYSTLILSIGLTMGCVDFPIDMDTETGDSASSETDTGNLETTTTVGDGDGDPGDGDGDDSSGDGDGDGDPGEFWAEVECINSICLGRRVGAQSWARVVHSSDLDIEIQTPLGGACFPDGFPAERCIQAGPEIRCFAGDGEWFAPFTCGTTPGVMDWPAWMCGQITPIVVPPWDAAGCHDEFASSCIATVGDAAFEIWPDCYVQMLIE